MINLIYLGPTSAHHVPIFNIKIIAASKCASGNAAIQAVAEPYRGYHCNGIVNEIA